MTDCRQQRVKKGAEMKARRVLVSIEVDTDARMADLKELGNWEFADNFSWKEFVIKQIQVNVVKKNAKDVNK